MLHEFIGTEPHEFPTVRMTTPDGEPHGAVIEPGEVVDVVAVDGVEGAPVINRLLTPKTEAPKAEPAVSAPTEE